MPVNTIRTSRTPHKMIARGGSLAGRVKDAYQLYGWLVRNVERLVEELHYHEVKTTEMMFQLSMNDAVSHCVAINLGCPTDRFENLLEAAKQGLIRSWKRGATATHMHLIASKLVRGRVVQQSLFDSPDDRAEVIAQVKRQINDRCGRFKLRSGATLYSNNFYDDPANEHDVCDIRGKFCF